MFKSLKAFGAVSIFAAAAGLLAISSPVQAHEPHVCPDWYPDSANMPGHIEQDDVVAGAYSLQDMVSHGETLFVGVYNKCDGQGRPATTGAGAKRIADEPAFIRTSAPESNSCAGCHAQPRAGGAGDFVANVFVLAQVRDPVTTSVSEDDSNERNTLGMFGASAIELLSREISTELQALRNAAIDGAAQTGLPQTVSLDSKGVNYGSLVAYPNGVVDTAGVEGVDANLVIKPFHQAGVVVSLREFTVNALNHHHGMQAEERFDMVLGDPDFDEDGITRELTVGDVTAAVMFQASLGVPGRVLPANPEKRATIDRGEMLFSDIGCASCHVPAMALNSSVFSEPNPFNPAGTWADTSMSFSIDLAKQGEGPHLEGLPGQAGALVRAYTDLKRHNLCDAEIDYFCNEQFDQGRPAHGGAPGAHFFLTRKLWDVANSAPYGHRGDLTTITDAIDVHGGEARSSRDAFQAMAIADQAAVVAFLKTLRVLPAGSPPVVIEGKEGRLAAADNMTVKGKK